MLRRERLHDIHPLRDYSVLAALQIIRGERGRRSRAKSAQIVCARRDMTSSLEARMTIGIPTDQTYQGLSMVTTLSILVYVANDSSNKSFVPPRGP